MRAPIGGAFERPGDETHHLGPMQRVNRTMRRYSESETVDFLVVGISAAGGVLIQRLARAGLPEA
jgi:hypothetical protein